MPVRLIFAAVLLWQVALPAFALQPDTAKCANAIECSVNSVVSLLPVWPANFTRNEEPEGSGIVIHDGSLIATADHVIGPAKEVYARTRDGRILATRIVMRDALSDVAFLKVDEELLPFNQWRTAEIAARSCAIGNSFGLDLSVTCGVVSGLEISGAGFNRIEDFIQTDAAINPGMSGGALVDEQGQLIGMISAIFAKQEGTNIGVNFAVSTALLDVLLSDFLKDQKVEHWLSGVLLKPLSNQKPGEKTGGKIVRVLPGSAEMEAGLIVGDVIVAVTGKRIGRAGAYERALALAAAKGELDLKVLRGNQSLQIKLKRKRMD